MLSPELVLKIKKLELKARHQVRDSFAGEYLSAFKGQGMEFDEVREYVAGDDVRSIDWNVTARMQEPFIKTFREEREQTLMLLVDVSASLNYGSQERNKREVAAEFAAILAFLAIRNNDKVGLIIFTDQVEHTIPPKKGRAHVFQIIKDILQFEAQGTHTHVGKALEEFSRVQKKHSTCFVISDFIDKSYETALKKASRRHDVTCVHIWDNLETSLPDVGVFDFIDLETGSHVLLDTSSEEERSLFQKQQMTKKEELWKSWRRLGVGVLSLPTDCSPVDVLLEHIKRRRRK